ncbi:MAG: serine/threonine-protein kinase [Chitinophagales bacterium]|nr:serine/threonine-protein kinase [Chitinophagales bacterium]
MTQEDFFKRYIYKPSTDKLGGGSFGKVYKAYDTVLDKYIALKVAEQMEVDGKKFTLSDEFNALANLDDHTNIAKYEHLYTFESPQGVFDYAIMQYYPDGNLTQLLKSQSINEEQKDSIARQLMNGIEFLHQNNVVHRDLKPSNILIHNRVLNNKKEFIPKITDFGLSKKASTQNNKDNHFTNSFAAGTYAYSSPEQLKGEPLRLNTDWWAYGAIVFEIFTGKPLFNVEKQSSGSSALDVKEILDSILKNDITDKISILPEKWQRVAIACLEKNPDQRVKTQDELLQLLEGTAITKENKIPIIEDMEDDATVLLTPKPKEPIASKSSKDRIKAQEVTPPTSAKTESSSEESFFKKYGMLIPILIGAIIGLAFLFKVINNNGSQLPNSKDIPYVASKDTSSSSTDTLEITQPKTIDKIPSSLQLPDGTPVGVKMKSDDWKATFVQKFNELEKNESKKSAAENLEAYKALKATIPQNATKEIGLVQKKINNFLLKSDNQNTKGKTVDANLIRQKLVGEYSFAMHSLSTTQKGTAKIYIDPFNILSLKLKQSVGGEELSFQGAIEIVDENQFNVSGIYFITKNNINNGQQFHVFPGQSFKKEGNVYRTYLSLKPYDNSNEIIDIYFNK